MKQPVFILFFCLAMSYSSFSQHKSGQKVFTQDIDHFWAAYDRIRQTKDSTQQLQLIRTLYIDKGTEGLKAFMEARDYSAGLWVDLINKYPGFWNSIRPNTLAVKSKAREIEKSIGRLKILYPELKEARMYFTIGALQSGGTTAGNMVLIGTEIATGDKTTDVSAFPDQWLAGVFREQSSEDFIPLNVHEYIHTQQRGSPGNLLAQAIMEGSCDFITERVTGKPRRTNYISYGMLHEKELKQKFGTDMFSTAYGYWLYNGGKAETVADLGYFMGYRICASYFNHAADKKRAVKDIIELNYSDADAVEAFLVQSKYFEGPIDKERARQAFEAGQPVLERLEPFANGDSLVDASVKELTLVFSRPMAKRFSISFTEKGPGAAPIEGVIGFSEDKKRFTVKVKLEPGRAYEFLVTNKSFQSADGYPLSQNYLIRFRTRP